MTLRFTKMHGLGNDFVLLDRRGGGDEPSAAAMRALADRRRGVGFDQLVSLERAEDADLAVVFHNADGGRAGACGNGVRCAAAYVMAESGAERLRIRTDAGIVAAERAGDRVRIDMGTPRLDWRDVPLACATATDALDPALTADWTERFGLDPIAPPGACSMGNPHLVLFGPIPDRARAETIGAAIGADPLFPEGVNVGFALPRGRRALDLRVRERGVGVTLACGTGACAAAVAARRAGLVEDGPIVVTLDGGALEIEWRERVLMTGPTTTVFEGALDLAALSPETAS